jgi:hypothetical protein
MNVGLFCRSYGELNKQEQYYSINYKLGYVINRLGSKESGCEYIIIKQKTIKIRILFEKT